MVRFPTRWLALALLIALVAIPLAGLGVALSGLWRADAEAAALADTASRFEVVAASQPDLAARSEAQIDNALVLPARAEGAYQRIGLRVALSTRIGPLQRILHALEAGQPSLFVDALQIRAEDLAADPVLSVTFDVYGYRPGGAI
jgi:hypothetical protein